MLTEENLAKVLSEIPLMSEAYSVYRCVFGGFIQTLTSTVGTEISDNRYSRRQILTGLYVSYEANVAMAEVEDYIRRTAILPNAPTINHFVFTMRLETQSILDLTDDETLKTLGTNYQELTGDWRLMNDLGHEAPTQILGRVAYMSNRIAAVRYRSRVSQNSANLLVFTERLSKPMEPIELPTQIPSQIKASK